MARKNYSFEKRQRELAKKKKQEDKRLQKAAAQRDRMQDDAAEAPTGASPEETQRSQS